MALTASLAIVGPWPVDDRPYERGEPWRRTLAGLAKAPGPGPDGPIRVGVAEVDLTPDRPRPLAGFIGQIRTPYEGVDSPCLGRALTVESPSGPLTILTADLLLINAKLARAIVDRAGVRPDEVYFTASHTHGGPGGWGDHPLEILVAGAYDPSIFEMLADRLAGAVRRSRGATEPAEVGFVEVQARGRQRNRVEPASTTHDALSALVFRPLGGPIGAGPIAILAVFGAHATVSHPVPPRLGGDYPAALASELKRRTGARAVLFASGAVGDASPSRPKAPSQAASARALGEALAGDLVAALPPSRFDPEPAVGSLRVVVDLPPVRLPFFSPSLRFGPLLTWWIADRRAHLHAIRIGPVALVGFPGDYSGDLADRLVGSTREAGLSTVATSFDGDYRGYLVSGSVFRRVSCYETRWMSFYGPWAGDMMTELARRMVGRLSGRPDGLDDPPEPGELGFRVALGALLIAAAPMAWRGRRGIAGAARRAGWFDVGAASAATLAFAIAPGWADWSTFGLPGWARWLGLPIGLLGLSGLAGRRPGRAGLLLAGSSALLASSWVVVLMATRGWARAGLSGDRAAADQKL